MMEGLTDGRKGKNNMSPDPEFVIAEMTCLFTAC